MPTKRRLLVLAASFFLLAAPLFAADPVAPAASEKGKILTVFKDHGSTKLFIETDQPLIAGGVIYVGAKKIPAVIGTMLSRTEQHYYYNASTEGDAEIAKGDTISLEPPKTLSGVSMFSLMDHQDYTFEQKHSATVMAVQGDRAMINRGSLQEVRERDLYRIYNSSGHYKGFLELHGIGDTQSSGLLYNPLGEFSRAAATTDVGDKAEYAGQRKFLGLGFIGGARSTNETVITDKESTFDFGFIWDTTFRDGWGLEVTFGAFTRNGMDSQNLNLPGNEGSYEQITNQSAFVVPVWFKKNFFYPRMISPFVAAGASLLTANVDYRYQVFSGMSTLTNIDESKKVTTIAPVVGAGIEFFQGYFFRPRIEIRYFDGPTVTAGADSYKTASLFYSGGFVMAW